MRRRHAVLLPILALGCAAVQTTAHLTPLSKDPLLDPAQRLQVDYALLGPASGKACERYRTLRKSPVKERHYKDLREPGTGHPMLYQAAKYAAIEGVAHADNLVEVRVLVEDAKREQCVTVTGQAYRLERITSVAEAPPADALAPLEMAPAVVGVVGEAGGAPPRLREARPAAATAVLLRTGVPFRGLPLGLALLRQGPVIGTELGVRATTGDVGGVAVLAGAVAAFSFFGDDWAPIAAVKTGYGDSSYSGPDVPLQALAGADLRVGTFVLRGEAGAQVGLISGEATGVLDVGFGYVF